MDNSAVPWLFWVPQLHVHGIARFNSDAARPKPVWGNLPIARRSAGEHEEFCVLWNPY
jgi:diadenosine tetraphosphate (Ap4A) HIT family hydrolase